MTMRKTIFTVALALAAMLAMALPAHAQDGGPAGFIAIESPLGETSAGEPLPGVVFGARAHENRLLTVDLYAKLRRAMWDEGSSIQTTAGTRISTAFRLWRLRPYVDVGFGELDGRFKPFDVFNYEVAPGANVYLGDNWGVGLAGEFQRIGALPGSITRTALHRGFTVSLFSNWGG